MTDKDNDELLERLISLEEDAVEERSEIKNRLDALEKESDDDDEDDDDEDEDDDEKSAIDGERLDKLEENISEMRSFLDELIRKNPGRKAPFLTTRRENLKTPPRSLNYERSWNHCSACTDR
ncbi:hypothetical protein ACFFQF_00890 [Haladaptatus pallidirubidus]|uniref:hypothetical protein n=1 Tax=Haladaptatus pallidirubidus TaxID=1008152 RepID=UPI0035EDE316